MLNADNIKCLAGDSSTILSRFEKFDWIYADPARRHDAKGKVFMLSDCQPNIPHLQDTYFDHSENIMVKTAPLLDIAAGLSELTGVKDIHVVAVNNEVKELLWILKKEYQGKVYINTVNILKNNVDAFSFELGAQALPTFGNPALYLYEPNSAIMKSGGFDEVAQRYGLVKLHRHTHLYTADKHIDFPGRVFKIEEVLPYSKSAMKEKLYGKQINVTVRNFPETVENIRRKWKLSDGGTQYCFFTTDVNDDKIALICSKID